MTDRRCEEQRIAAVADRLVELGFNARCGERSGEVELEIEGPGPERRAALSGGSPAALLEQALRAVPLDFDDLPLVVEGDSKEVREWTSRAVVERLKPTVYSFTRNRYGLAPGTDVVRARFSAEVFRRLGVELATLELPVRTAFAALLETRDGPLLVQRKVETCNLEVRVKRYHIGSPLHRYLYTDRHPTAGNGEPLRRWSRFESPAVCFDWRHPLVDGEGKRLADEPLPDDYAAVWMEDVASAKEIARRTFCWLESMLASVGVLLVDICLLIDRSGHVLFGEISPDCMRIRLGQGDPVSAEPLDKDLWRNGASPALLAERYNHVYELLREAPPMGDGDGAVHRR